MKEVMKISFNALEDCVELEDWVNEFLEDHDPVSIQMGILPDGKTQVMIVYRDSIKEKKDEATAVDGKGAE